MEELRRGKVLRTRREEGRGETCEDLSRRPGWHFQAASLGCDVSQGKDFVSLGRLDLAPSEMPLRWKY